MLKAIVLDTHPLSNVAVPPATPGNAATYAQQCLQWIEDCIAAGVRVYVPGVAYYEALRDLERRGATAQIQRLKRFCFEPMRFIPVAMEHLEAAAVLWARARNTGTQTASDESLDADVILAAQVLVLQLDPADYLVATSNAKHLAQFVPTEDWREIAP